MGRQIKNYILSVISILNFSLISVYNIVYIEVKFSYSHLYSQFFQDLCKLNYEDIIALLLLFYDIDTNIAGISNARLNALLSSATF